MVFGRGYRNRRSAKPAQLTTNHCIVTPFTTAAFIETQTPVFTAQEPPTNRGDHIPTGAMLKGVDIQLWGQESGGDGVSIGLHRCLMVYRPASTAYGTPIASWLSTADPLTEEAIQIRQHKMMRLHQTIITSDGIQPTYWRCAWRGNITLRQGDSIVVVTEDQLATDWRGLCTAWWIA